MKTKLIAILITVLIVLCLSAKVFVGMNEAEATTKSRVAQKVDEIWFPEPNEPEESELHIICDCGMKYDIRGKEICFKSRYTLLTDFVKVINPKNSIIPTWPEYIELEKTLVFSFPKEPNSPYTGAYMQLDKGTKIYFRED